MLTGTHIYDNKVRVRVCGLFVKDNRILLVKHKGVGPRSEYWSPPGGGMEFGQSAKSNLEREFIEETGLKPVVGELLIVNEFLDPPLHAIELFFAINDATGQLITGLDPELSEADQLIEEVRFVTFEELSVMDNEIKHKLLHGLSSLNDIKRLALFN